MARLPRLYLAEHSHLMLLEAHGASDPLNELDVLRAARSALEVSSQAAQFRLEGYALLPRAVWLMGKPAQANSLGKMVQGFTKHLAPSLRARGLDTKSIWQSRFRSTVLQAGTYTLNAMLLVDSAGPRLIPGASVTDWPWSSALQRIGQTHEKTMTVHDPAEFWSLGNTPFERQTRYLNALNEIPTGLAISLESTVRRNWVAGDEQFRGHVEATTGRRAAPVARGRKSKSQ